LNRSELLQSGKISNIYNKVFGLANILHYIYIDDKTN